MIDGVFVVAAWTLAAIFYAMWNLHGLRLPTNYKPRRYKKSYSEYVPPAMSKCGECDALICGMGVHMVEVYHRAWCRNPVICPTCKH